MSADRKSSFFLDTNLLIYAIDPGDPRKQAIALQWIERLLSEDREPFRSW
jgi:hypothetical protein